jgi:coproporphyrinogen III oxidase
MGGYNMKIDEFVENMKRKAAKGLLEVSGTGKLVERTWTFPKGTSEMVLIRGGAIEKASIQHLKLRGIAQPGVTGEVEHEVYQMEVFPEHPYCPMGHFNTEWSTAEPRLYYMNLDLFPAVRVEEDLKAMRSAMDVVADRFGRDREKMREGLDTHYTLEHFPTPLATRVGCKLLELKDKDLDFFIAAYETFFDCYLDIIQRRKGIAYTDSEMQLKLERNGRWLEYLTLKDRAVKAARDILPAEVLIEQGFPPSAIF